MLAGNCWQVRSTVRERVEAAVEAARREVDADELAQVPRAELEPRFLDFGVVSCDIERDLVLTNTGQVGSPELRDLILAANVPTISAAPTVIPIACVECAVCFACDAHGESKVD